MLYYIIIKMTVKKFIPTNGIPVEFGTTFIDYSNFVKEVLMDDEDNDDDNVELNVPFDSETIKFCVKFCELYNRDKYTLSSMKPLKTNNFNELVPYWCNNMFNDINEQTLMNVLMASDYLHIDILLDTTCTKIATILKGKSVEEITKAFDILNDFTEEEKNYFTKAHNWWTNDVVEEELIE